MDGISYDVSWRIRADMNYLDSDRGDLVRKPVEFRNWFDSMQNWIRKGFKHLTLLTYVGPALRNLRMKEEYSTSRSTISFSSSRPKEQLT